MDLKEIVSEVMKKIYDDVNVIDEKENKDLFDEFNKIVEFYNDNENNDILFDEKKLKFIFSGFNNNKYDNLTKGIILPGNPYYQEYSKWEEFYKINPEQANNREYMVSLNPTSAGKKRRTKRSKAPTAKRTRAKKCAKKATKRTAKKMRS